MNEFRKYINIMEGFYDRMFKILSIDNDAGINTLGTSKQGIIRYTYQDLVDTFGEPTIKGTEDDNFTVMWNLEFKTQHKDDAGTLDNELIVATIYDWNYFETEKIEEVLWTVGGFGKDNVTLVILQAINPPHPIHYYEE